MPRTAVGSAPAAGAGAVAACVGTGTSAALAVASSSPHGDTPMRRPVGWSSKTLWKAAAARRDLCPAGGRRRVDGEQAAGGCPRRSGQQMGAPSRPVGGLRGGVSLVVVDGALAETAAAVGTAAARATLHLLCPRRSIARPPLILPDQAVTPSPPSAVRWLSLTCSALYIPKCRRCRTRRRAGEGKGRAPAIGRSPPWSVTARMCPAGGGSRRSDRKSSPCAGDTRRAQPRVVRSQPKSRHCRFRATPHPVGRAGCRAHPPRRRRPESCGDHGGVDLQGQGIVEQRSLVTPAWRRPRSVGAAE